MHYFFLISQLNIAIFSNIEGLLKNYVTHIGSFLTPSTQWSVKVETWQFALVRYQNILSYCLKAQPCKLMELFVIKQTIRYLYNKCRNLLGILDNPKLVSYVHSLMLI